MIVQKLSVGEFKELKKVRSVLARLEPVFREVEEMIAEDLIETPFEVVLATGVDLDEVSFEGTVFLLKMLLEIDGRGDVRSFGRCHRQVIGWGNQLIERGLPWLGRLVHEWWYISDIAGIVDMMHVSDFYNVPEWEPFAPFAKLLRNMVVFEGQTEALLRDSIEKHGEANERSRMGDIYELVPGHRPATARQSDEEWVVVYSVDLTTEAGEEYMRRVSKMTLEVRDIIFTVSDVRIRLTTSEGNMAFHFSPVTGELHFGETLISLKPVFKLLAVPHFYEYLKYVATYLYMSFVTSELVTEVRADAEEGEDSILDDKEGAEFDGAEDKGVVELAGDVDDARGDEREPEVDEAPVDVQEGDNMEPDEPALAHPNPVPYVKGIKFKHAVRVFKRLGAKVYGGGNHRIVELNGLRASINNAHQTNERIILKSCRCACAQIGIPFEEFVRNM